MECDKQIRNSEHGICYILADSDKSLDCSRRLWTTVPVLLYSAQSRERGKVRSTTDPTHPAKSHACATSTAKKMVRRVRERAERHSKRRFVFLREQCCGVRCCGRLLAADCPPVAILSHTVARAHCAVFLPSTALREVCCLCISLCRSERCRCPLPLCRPSLLLKLHPV
jgi:hypothetical protein